MSFFKELFHKTEQILWSVFLKPFFFSFDPEKVHHFVFGFVEVGTITPKPQFGNPKPRLFRLKSDKALINRMGFNNDGVDKIVDRLRNKGNVIIGGNIGKNKVTPNENAKDDYLTCFKALYDHVDYFAVNVSSPNTPNLRDLQNINDLREILFPLIKENKKRETKQV